MKDYNIDVAILQETHGEGDKNAAKKKISGDNLMASVNAAKHGLATLDKSFKTSKLWKTIRYMQQ